MRGSAMSIVVTCSCGKRLLAKVELAGTVVQCPACHERIKVPAATKPEESGSRKVWLVAGLAAGVVLCGALAVGYFNWKRGHSPQGVSHTGNAPARNPNAPKVAPSITATPNPVPAGETKFGTTTVTWDTGDGSIGEVYVSVNGAAEKLFAGNRSKGSLAAAWIGKGEHEFRLYAGKEHKTLLASVRVTRSK